MKMAFNRTSLELKFLSRLGCIWPPRRLQSHLTGIEIRISKKIRWKCPSLQSHLTGIEMPEEGKRKSPGLFLQSHLTGIEIRILACQLYLFGGLQSHLTGIEIPEGYWYSLPGRGPSIAPHWNWNSLSLISNTITQSPSIAPHWNWNMVKSLTKSGTEAPSIAPHWNWNGCIQNQNFGTSGSFNRTSLELK